MYDKKELCERIKSIFPHVGDYGVDFDVERDALENRWQIRMKKGEKEYSAWIDEKEAGLCMEENTCIGLLADIAQFRVAVENRP